MHGAVTIITSTVSLSLLLLYLIALAGSWLALDKAVDVALMLILLFR